MIPAKAVAKVSIRLVPNQNPDAVVKAFREWANQNTPKGIQIEVRVLSAGPGLVVNPDHPAIRVAARAFGDVFGKPTVFIRSGGSIPIVGDFATHLGIPTILMGFGLPDDGLYSPNEVQDRELLHGHHDSGALPRTVRRGVGLNLCAITAHANVALSAAAVAAVPAIMYCNRPCGGGISQSSHSAMAPIKSKPDTAGSAARLSFRVTNQFYMLVRLVHSYAKVFESPITKVSIAIALLGICACSKGPPRAQPIGEAFVGPAVLKIRSDIPLQSSTVTTVKHGDRLQILQTRRRFLRVRTPHGVEGWTDERQMLAASDMDSLRKLTTQAAKCPRKESAQPTHRSTSIPSR